MQGTIVDLLEGNRVHADAAADRFDDVQHEQHPDTVSVCCSDSRVLQDDLWGNHEPGRVFTVGNIGNRVVQRTDQGDVVVSGDVLYPLAYTDTGTAVVVGHTGCGAVTATYDAVRADRDGTVVHEDAPTPMPASAHPPGIERCIDLLRQYVEPGVDHLPAGCSYADAVNRLVEYNVDRQVDAIRNCEDATAGTSVFGVVYDFQDVYDGDRGEVHVVNADGEHDPAVVRDAIPEVTDRVQRLLEY
jgi:carbonic anhydrase